MSPEQKQAIAVFRALPDPLSFGQIAKRLGLSRSAVCGEDWRRRHPYRPRTRRVSRRLWVAPTPARDAVMSALYDGRARSTTEIAAKIGAKHRNVSDVLRSLQREGAVKIVLRGVGGLPSVWLDAEAA